MILYYKKQDMSKYNFLLYLLLYLLMKIVKITGFILLIAFGVFMVIYGEGDDSPGAQGLGLISAIIGIIGAYKQIRKK